MPKPKVFLSVEVSYPSEWYWEGADAWVDAEMAPFQGRWWASGMGGGLRDVAYEVPDRAHARRAVQYLQEVYGEMGVQARAKALRD